MASEDEDGGRNIGIGVNIDGKEVEDSDARTDAQQNEGTCYLAK